VVVAAGNAGFGDRALNDPAYDPYLLAVGASDHRGTADPSDDGVAAFSSIGTDRGPDLVAPGRSVLSLRAPASYLDVTYPDARVGDALFRGSGTSQAAAVVSGAAALLIAQRPDSTPDGIKAVLRGTARPLDGDPAGQGAGALDLAAAYAAPTPDAVQTWDRAAGSGSIDLARGSVRLSRDGVVLDGERDIFGTTFDASSWSGKARARSGWGEGRWNGNSWSGQGWTGNSWSGQLTGGSWFGNSWSGAWFGNSWSCAWSGNSWSGVWSGNSWSGELMGSSWSTAAWGN
jgi:serine protease AprX